MKTMKWLMACMFVLSGFVLAGCSSDENGSEGSTERFYEELLKRSPTQLMPREELPSWLDEKLGYYEDNPKLAPFIQVFQGEWKGEVLYFLYNPVNSCLFCNVYSSDGESFDMTERDDSWDIYQSSRDWKCIYLLKIFE